MPTPDLPEEARPELGFLSLGSRPPAGVLIDGVDIGQQTPLLSWPLRGGAHEIQLIADGRTEELSVEIQAGQTRSEVIDLGAAKKRGRR